MPDEALTRVNGSVLLFTLGVVLVSTLLFGLAPALLAVTRDLHELLKASGRGAGESLAHGRLRNLLVVSEVTLSMVLLTGAGLLIRSFFAVRHVETGYNPDHVLAAGTDLPEQRYKTLEQRNQFCWEVLRRVRALPGVISAAFGDPRPLDPGFGSTPIEIAGKTSAGKRSAWVRLSSDGLFETMGIRLLQGRTISEEDMLQARKVAIVNRAFVTEHFGDENPLGQQIRTMEPAETKVPPVQQPWFEIVGVVADTKYNPEAPAQPAIYVPYMVDGFPEYSTLFVQSVGKPEILANSLRHVVVAIDNEVPLNWSTLRDELRSGW
jgi:putative ABC transport system permease protein